MSGQHPIIEAYFKTHSSIRPDDVDRLAAEVWQRGVPHDRDIHDLQRLYPEMPEAIREAAISLEESACVDVGRRLDLGVSR